MVQPLFLDVMIGPMIAVLAGVYVILPALLIGLVILITVKLIKKIKNDRR